MLVWVLASAHSLFQTGAYPCISEALLCLILVPPPTLQVTAKNNYMNNNNWDSFTFIDLFAGIGGIRLGFESIGGTCVFSSEWDAAAQKTYEANFGEKPSGDITAIASECIPDHDILLGGFPCQPFSIIGSKKGFNDARGTLFFEIERILRAKKPKAIMLENVKQFKTHNKGNTFNTVISILNDIGYTTYSTILNALDFGVPHKRERTFIVGFLDKIQFKFPEIVHVQAHLESVLEKDTDIDKKLFASPKIVANRQKKISEQGTRPFYPSIWHENKSGNVSIHPFSCALRSGASYNYLLVNGVRRPSSRELLRLQGFPDSFKIVVSHQEIRRQTGNSVAVPVIKAIATSMLQALREQRPVVSPPVQASLISL